MEANTDSGSLAKGVIATLLAFLMLASTSVFAKLEMQAGATIEWLVFVQYLTSFLIVMFIAWRRKFADAKTEKLRFHLVRGIAGILAFLFFIIAISKIPLVNASLLNNTAPLFIPIISMIWMGTAVGKNIWLAILLGFAGVVFILDPVAGEFLKPGDIIGLSSGILLAIAYVALGQLTKTENFVTILFYYSLISMFMLFPIAVSNWSNPPLLIWFYAVVSGIFFVSYLYLLQYAYRFVPAVKLAPLNFSAVVFTGIFDWIVFSNVPGVMSLIGILMVITGGILSIVLHEKDNKELRHHWH